MNNQELEQQSQRFSATTNINIKKTVAKTTRREKRRLMRRGKRDGKKGIPYRDSNGNWISPIIAEEGDRINLLISGYYRQLNEKNLTQFSSLATAVADYESTAIEMQRLHDYLVKKIPALEQPDCTIIRNISLSAEQLALLDAKRNSEQGLEEICIRARRFHEYQQPLIPLRKRFLSERSSLESKFEVIVHYYEQIAQTNKLLDVIYYELGVAADTRIGWYWQGVIKKHPQKDQLKLTVPKLSASAISSRFGANLIELSKKIEDLKETRDQLLRLSVV